MQNLTGDDLLIGDCISSNKDGEVFSVENICGVVMIKGRDNKSGRGGHKYTPLSKIDLSLYTKTEKSVV